MLFGITDINFGHGDMNRCTKLSPHRYRGCEGYEYACPLTLGKLPVDEISRQFCCCNFVTSKGELIENGMVEACNG